MAVQQPQPQPAPPEQPHRSRAAGLAWAIAAVALIIVASTGSAFLAYLMFNRQLPMAQQPAGERGVVSSPSAPAESAEAAAVAPLGPTLDAGEFVVNLAPGSGGLSIRYARVGVTVEADRREVVEELARRQPQVRDAIIAVIRTKRFEDLTSTAGTEAVRQELVQALQRLVSRGRVVNVYFTELVIQ
ncbi:flagellar basal body-associated FliL family protein [Geochorda subterranea]|uniref:Flagellar protein FliL n=1 Tax=Geochorda subterranea TaxID=3109564 RepID=A0ABZ1BKL1_9FIRM|nr:flagellar basal body-associated FliL family protein [Limnochorda sp. LNt]WRP13328.1 flagellar basal body-associated FliL family protein [Limnochorda sp. LNt]